MQEGNVNLNLIDENVKSPFLLQDLTYDCDYDFQEVEFKYLTGLKVGANVTSLDLKNAIFYLKEKNRFKDILLQVKDKYNAKKLHFKFTSTQVLKKVKITGLLVNKDKYRKLYLIEPGQEFMQQKHRESIELIRSKFFKNGYFNVKISSNLKLDKKNKSIEVVLTIDKGKRFSIKNVDLQFTNSYLSKNELDQITNKYSKRFLKPKYNYLMINKERKSLKSYLTTLGFFNTKIDFKRIINADQSINLIIRIKLNDQIKINLEGNKFLSKNSLIKQIFVQNNFDSINEFFINEQILNLYKQSGYFQARCSAKKSDNAYIVKIDEGPVCKLMNLKVEGNKFFSFKSIKHKYFKYLINSKTIKYDAINSAEQLLIHDYNENGFWDVQLKHRYIHIENEKYELELLIDEKEQKFLNSISCDLNNEELKKYFLQFKLKAPLGLSILNSQYKYIYSFLTKLGCSSLSIVPEITEDKCFIDVFWKIQFQNNSTKFGKVILRNSNDLPFEKLLNQIQSVENEQWSKEILEKSFNNLNDLNLFESINIQPNENYDLNQNKPILIKLRREDKFELRTRLGFQQVSRNLAIKGLATYRAGGSFIVKNPFNQCDEFQINVDYSRLQNLFSCQYKLPQFSVFPCKTMFQVYLNQYYQPLYIGSVKNLYQVNDFGYFANFTKKNNISNFSINMGIESIKIFNLSIDLAKAIDFSPSLIDENIPYVSIEPNLFLDKFNDKLNPSNGWLSVFYLKAMFSLKNSNDYFLKFLFEQTFYSDSFNPIILALRLRFGHVFANDFSHLSPPIRFFLGGPNSVRSYLPDFSPPFGAYTDEHGQRQFVPQGGRTMFNMNFELRIPALKQLMIVLFQDIGMLLKGDEKWQKENFLTATGFGLRYLTPIGPIRFDIGWRKKHHPNDSSFAWYLTLGHAF